MLDKSGRCSKDKVKCRESHPIVCESLSNLRTALMLHIELASDWDHHNHHPELSQVMKLISGKEKRKCLTIFFIYISSLHY